MSSSAERLPTGGGLLDLPERDDLGEFRLARSSALLRSLPKVRPHVIHDGGAEVGS